MRKRWLVRNWRPGTWAGFLVTMLGVVGLAASTLPAAPPAAGASVADDARRSTSESLERGAELERQGRWADALTYYEKAVRLNPDRADLHQRLTQVRIHYDLARRYADRSYCKTFENLSLAAALSTFAEVAAKVDYHYVERPDWTALMVRGTDGLEAAFGEEAFLRQHRLPNPAPAGLAVVSQVRQALAGRTISDRREAQDMVRWVDGLAQRQLGLQPGVVVMEYACSLVSSLDNYSTFLTEQQLDEVYSQIEGNFVGLGVELKAEHDRLLIVDVIAGGPAEKAGITPRSQILAIDGRPVETGLTQQAADRLKGEMGTQVSLELLTPQGDHRSVVVRRDRVEVPSVEEVKILDPQLGVAYVRLTSFQKTTSRELDAALWQLHQQGMRSLIVDVRGNPGGSLPECVEVVDKFLADGTIVRTRGRSAQEDFDYRAHRVGTWQLPLVVLIDTDSASASEIFAGAIRDHQRGTIVGERSYGKGSVQGIFPLRSMRAGVRLTTAKFYSPNGQAISPYGISPDVPVQVVARPVGADLPAAAQDAGLQAALQVARQHRP